MRTSQQYLNSLFAMKKNIYLDGELIGRDDPRIVRASKAIQLTFDLAEGSQIQKVAGYHFPSTVNQSIVLLIFIKARKTC